ncbi:MAG: hypothetical protein ACXW2G_09120 [Burkholderiaceae bacterium]
MTPTHREDRALRREALAARAALQRIQIASAFGQARSSAVNPKVLAGLALRIASSWAGSQTRQGTRMPWAPARPWMLSAAWLLVRGLRASPTARWLAGAGAAGVAIYWVVQALRTPEAGDDESG